MSEAYIVCRTHNTDYFSSDLEIDMSWATYYQDHSVNPNTGQPWTWAEINALQAGIKLTGEEGEEPECTQVYVEVTYTPSGIARLLVGGSLAGNSLVGKGLAR